MFVAATSRQVETLLNVLPVVEEMEDECWRRKLEMAGAIAAIAATIALNELVFGGGAFILALAPFGWLLWSWRRLHALRRSLARVRGHGSAARTAGDDGMRQGEPRT